jgi:LacI family repressor for deo operon, udp, cdd, tsx, nupC, and nupG
VPVRASIVDVARLAGVSVATVSRALRGLPNVSVPTRERVLSAAQELEYIASPLAAALVTGRTRSVGVMASSADHWFFTEVVRGIEEGLRDRGYDLVLHVLSEGVRRRQFFTGLPVRRRVDALVVAGMRLTGGELETLRQLQLPIACVAEPLEGVHTERIDNEAAARLAVQHLIDLGHTRIAMIGGADTSEDSRAPAGRARGYLAALSASGLEPAAILDGEFTPAGGAAAMAELLARGRTPTAVFCQSDEMAFGALHTLHRAGLCCPDAVSVIGFDDHELAASFDLTTIGQPICEQGAAAARWLPAGLDRYPAPGAGLAANGHADQPPLADAVHPVRLVLRGSTAPVEANASSTESSR